MTASKYCHILCCTRVVLELPDLTAVKRLKNPFFFRKALPESKNHIILLKMIMELE
jgi:hypothetical protein